MKNRILFGAIGGLIGAWAMDKFQEQLSGDKGTAAKNRWHRAPATVRTASKLADIFLKRELTEREMRFAAPAVHYAFGAVNGAIYAATINSKLGRKPYWSVLYGTGLWASADEIAVPLLKLAESPWKFGWKSHAAALAAHWIYGLSVDGTTRAADAATEASTHKRPTSSKLAVSEVNSFKGRQTPVDSWPNDVATPDREDTSTNEDRIP